MSNFIPDSIQRKALEKVYARVFDLPNGGSFKGKTPELSAEGKDLLKQAKVDPEDLMIKTLDDFRNANDKAEGSPSKNKVQPPNPKIFIAYTSLPEDKKKVVKDPEILKKEHEEVAKIRFEHHQIKRMRKLQMIHSMIEQQAVKKRMEKEKADRDFYEKANKNISKTIDDENGQPSGRSKYKERIDRMLATQQTPLASQRKTPGISKVSFYHRNNRSMLAERGLVTLSNSSQPFKSEDGRSKPMTKTEERYLKARQNLEIIAQRDAEQLNIMALNKVKKQKMGEKAQHDMEMYRKAQREKHNDRFLQIQTHKNQEVKQQTHQAIAKYREDCREIEDRIKIKYSKEKDISHRNWLNWIKTQQDGGFQSSKLSGSESNSPITNRDKSMPGFENGMSKTFQARGLYGDFMNKLEAEEKLKKYEEKLQKGAEKIKQQHEIKRQRVREQLKNIPDISELRKKEQDDSNAGWEKYLIKTSEVEKTKQQILKKDAAIRKEKQLQNLEKMQVVKQNIKHSRREMQEKAEEINQKFEQMDLKIDMANQRKMMYSVKHRELENLRFRDFEELRQDNHEKKLRDKCEIVEKHIGMAIALQEKKQQQMVNNDKIRVKMAKETSTKRNQLGDAKTPYFKVRNDQVSVAAFAPDLVKWTPKDIKKIMDKDKKEE